jgi:hypothetical protein
VQAEVALPTAALFPTSAPTSDQAGALDAAIRRALADLDVVRVTARPGLDLAAVQLAIDCVGENARCLGAVAEQSGTQLLIAPSLERANDVTSLRLLKFDTQSRTPLQRVERQERGDALPQLSEAVPEMLRELFGLSRPASTAEPVAEVPAAAESKDPQPKAAPNEVPPPAAASVATERERALPLAPIVLAAAGAAVLGGGIVAGVMKQNSQNEYEDLVRQVPGDEGEVDAAIDVRDGVKSQAVLATVLLSVGSAAIAAGGIWLALELSQSRERPQTPRATAFVPLIAPDQLGLAIVHRGAAL